MHTYIYTYKHVKIEERIHSKRVEVQAGLRKGVATYIHTNMQTTHTYIVTNKHAYTPYIQPTNIHTHLEDSTRGRVEECGGFREGSWLQLGYMLFNVAFRGYVNIRIYIYEYIDEFCI